MSTTLIMQLSKLKFLLETHIRPLEQNWWHCSWADLQCTFSSKAHGVVIAIKKNTPFKHISTISDPNSWFIIVTGYLYSAHVKVLNIYGLSIDDTAFSHKTFDMLPDFSNTNVIAVGDHNIILDLYLPSFVLVEEENPGLSPPDIVCVQNQTQVDLPAGSI